MNNFIKILLTALLAIICIFASFFIASMKDLFMVKPNLILCLVIIFTMYFKSKVSIIFSTIMGSFIDIIYISDTFGMYTLSYGILSIIIYVICTRYVKSNLISTISIGVVGTFIFEFTQYVINIFAFNANIGFFKFIGICVVSIVLNLVFQIIIFNLLDKIHKKSQTFYEYSYKL